MSLNTVDLTSYTPDPTGTADQSGLLQQAISDTPTNGTLLIPGGVYRLTTGLAIDRCIHVRAEGATLLYDADTGAAALTIAAASGSDVDAGTVRGLALTKKVRNWAAPIAGLLLQNAKYWLLDGISSSNFAYGIQFTGDGQGCNYNRLWLRLLQDNLVNLYIVNRNGGWADENIVDGGLWVHHQPGGTHIKAEQTVLATRSPAHWNFIGGSFNAPDSNTTCFDFICGATIRFHGPHFETLPGGGLMPAFWRANTANCAIIHPGPNLIALTDQGVQNVVWQNGTELDCTAPWIIKSPSPSLRIQESSSGGLKQIRIGHDVANQLQVIDATFNGGTAWPLVLKVAGQEQMRLDMVQAVLKRVVCANVATNVVETSGDYMVQTTDGVIMADATGGNRTVTLLSAAVAAKAQLTVIKTDGSANTVTIVRTGSDTINGGTSVVLDATTRGALIYNNGVSKYVALRAT